MLVNKGNLRDKIGVGSKTKLTKKLFNLYIKQLLSWFFCLCFDTFVFPRPHYFGIFLSRLCQFVVFKRGLLIVNESWAVSCVCFQSPFLSTKSILGVSVLPFQLRPKKIKVKYAFWIVDENRLVNLKTKTA